MIKESELTHIGHIVKPHGIDGEMVLATDFDPSELSCVVMDIDGIYVPFFINTVRRRGAESYLVTIDDVADEKAASSFKGKTVHALTRDLPDDVVDEDDDSDEEGLYVDDLVGCDIVTPAGEPVGHVDDYDDSTDNVLLIVSRHGDGQRVYIPAAAEFIAGMDAEARVLVMDLPAGLLEI